MSLMNLSHQHPAALYRYKQIRRFTRQKITGMNLRIHAIT